MTPEQLEAQLLEAAANLPNGMYMGPFDFGVRPYDGVYVANGARVCPLGALLLGKPVSRQEEDEEGRPIAAFWERGSIFDTLRSLGLPGGAVLAFSEGYDDKKLPSEARDYGDFYRLGRKMRKALPNQLKA